MRKQFTLLLLLIATQLLAQTYPITGIVITLPQNPDPIIANWSKTGSMFSISAQTALVNGRIEERVRDSRLLVTVRKSGSRACGSYTASSAPSANFSTPTKIWTGNNALSLIGQDCTLPPGDYELVVQFFGNGPAGSMALSEERIKNFTIRGTETESFPAPVLIFPADGTAMTEADLLKPVTFRWFQAPKPAGTITYRLRVWQLAEGQTPAQSIRNTEPIITKDVSDVTEAVVVQLRQPPPNRNLVWNVQALNRDGKPIGQSNGTSEAFTIHVNPVNDPPSILTLITPGNKAVLSSKEYPRFSWTHTRQQPGPISTYKIKIVEIIADQSPEQAMRGNKPHFEKDSLKERFFHYPRTGKTLETGKRYAWNISASRDPAYGEVKITESEINEFIVRSMPPSPPCPAFTVTSNFNCQGFAVESIVTNPSSTLTVTSWTLQSPNTTLIDPSGTQIAPGTSMIQMSTPGNVTTINAGQTVSGNSIGVLQPNGGTTMTLIYAFHLSNGQVCEIENNVTWYPNCAASLCACGTWSNFEYGYYANGVITGTPQQMQIPLTGNTGTITVAQGSRIFPGTGFNCTGNCGNENYMYDLYKVGNPNPIISHTWGANLSDDGHVVEQQFGCGDYVLTVYPSCLGAVALACATATIQIHVTCTNPCECGVWNPVTVKVGNGQTVTVPCDNSNSPVTMNVTDPITIHASINCSPANASCTGTQLADIFYPNGNLAAGNVSLPLTNWILPQQNICGLLKVVLKGKCSTFNCPSCTIYFNITCPPPPVCSCTWSQVAWTNNGVSQTKINACGETVNTTPGNMVFFPAYSCTPSTCAKTPITYTITSNGVVVGAANRPITTATGNLLPGTYQVTFTGSCNGTVCTCSVTLVVAAPCQCAGWNAIPYTANGNPQTAVQPGGVLSGAAGTNYLFSPSYSCNPATCAQTNVTYTITKNGVVVGAANRPAGTPTGILTAGLYLVTFTGSCGGTTCTTTIRLNIPAGCSCNGWEKLAYTLPEATEDYLPIKCPSSEAVLIHLYDKMNFIAVPSCIGEGCERMGTIEIFHPNNTSGTPNETLNATQGLNYKFERCGEYILKFRGSCGNTACPPCEMRVKVDCPSTICGCTGITAIKFKKQGSTTDTTVQCSSAPVVLNAMQGDVFSSFAALFTCSGPANCQKTSFVDVYLPNSSAFTTHSLQGDHPFGYRFDKCGQYKLVFRGKCGTISCSSCTILVNVSPSCCDYIKVNSFNLNPNAGTYSVSFSTNGNLTFSKVKVQILELTSAGIAKPAANIKTLNKATAPAWGAGNRNVAITGTSVTNQATAFWYPPPGPYTDPPAVLAFTGQLAYFSPLTAPVKFTLRFTFYRTDPSCGNTICEKDVTFTN